MNLFADEAVIEVKAGNGGNGCISFRREKYVPRGGPNGGDGGKGGDVVFVCRRNVRTLANIRYKHFFRAKSGGDGQGWNKYGRDGEDVVIAVPPGTVIRDFETNELIKEFTFETDDEPYILLKGGNGGWGNVHFKSPTNQAPRIANKGQIGLENKLRLQNIRFFDNNIELIARAFQRQFIFFFDKNLNNPLPQLVQVYNSAQNRDSCEITLTDGAAKGALFLKISAYKTAKGYMYVPIKISKDNQDYFFLEYYEREEFLAMLEKIFSNFFNCEYFSYVAPCLFYDFYSFYNKNSESWCVAGR